LLIKESKHHMHATSSVSTPHAHTPPTAAQNSRAIHEEKTAAADQAVKVQHSAPPAGTGKIMDISA
jgi:hypothetical protein